MDKVATLICNPSAPLLDEALAGRVSARLGADRRVTLAQGVAEDFFWAGAPDAIEARRALTEAIGGLPVDIVVQPLANRRKRLLIADMDSTIIEQECIDELADFVGKRAEIAAITERAMRGELNFEAALLERLMMLNGLPVTALAEVFDNRITLTPGAKTLVRTMNKLGAATALVSGGFTYFTSRVAAAVGFAMHEANELLSAHGRLIGDVARPIRGREAKEEALIRLAADRKIPLAETMAVGDGANDMAMLHRAGLGVAFHAKPAVAAVAGARIDHGNLTALLYLQGVSKAEFVD
ncbi:MAG: phosphoserine phosphatase SerB [Parvularculaceae bacterium]